MSEYRVYKTGESEPVRVSGSVSPEPLAALGREQRAPRREPAARSAGLRTLVIWAAIAVAAAVAAGLFWFYGRDMLGNSRAAFDLARLSGKVPGWAMVGAPVIAVAIVAAVTAYLAFGSHLAVKLIGVAVVMAALAAPGMALGWANGTVSVVAHRTAEQEVIVTETEKELRPALPGKAMNILLIGSDKTKIPGDTGRSDTQILVRLDPETKSISMFSVPRDLRVLIPDHGYDKMNTAYAYGGPPLAVKTFTELTGLPINHFVEVNFSGFWHVVNILGGVYIPIDHRYYVPESADYKSIDIEPGYQLIRGHDALDFVRYRHDQLGDFTRMQRQQLFLKEMQRQSTRWSGDWTKVIRLIKAITKETTSDIDSLKRLQPLVELIFQVNTSKVYTAHLEGSTPMIDGVSYVVPTQAEIDQAVGEFTHPTQAPVAVKGIKLTKKMYPVTVYNGSGIGGRSTTAVDQLIALGYRAETGADAPEFPGTVTVVYAPKSLAAPAELIGEMFWPSDVRLVDRSPGVADGISVFVTSSFDGFLAVPQEAQQTQQTLQKNQLYDAAAWSDFATKTPLHLEMPTAWSLGFTYDEFRAYGIKTTEGKRSAAAVAVVATPLGGYWGIQAMRWMDPPAIQNPNSTQVIAGQEYMLFYQADHLHMMAWKRNGTLYWVLNTLDNQLSNDLMMGLATSFKPVK
ncbi:MAG: LCP family protein [Actinobacteria bacterium]|nr:LCP family protein [Actinomycetota bacterium]